MTLAFLVFVQLWVFQFDVLLQRTLRTVTTTAVVSFAVVFPFDLLSCPPGSLVALSLGLALVGLVALLFVASGFVQGCELGLDRWVGTSMELILCARFSLALVCLRSYEQSLKEVRYIFLNYSQYLCWMLVSRVGYSRCEWMPSSWWQCGVGRRASISGIDFESSCRWKCWRWN